MRGLGLDLCFAWRRIKATPGIAAIAVLSLALGIGANTAIFSIIESALLRGLPVPQPDRLIYLRDRQPCCDAASLSPGEYLDYERQTRTLSGLAAAVNQTLILTGRSEPSKLNALAVTPNYFDVLGVGAARGRLMSPAIDNSASDTRVAVLSYPTWIALFAGDPSIIGRDLTLSGHRFRVIGVLRKDEAYPAKTQIWVSPRFSVPEYVEISGAPAALARNLVQTYDDHWLFAIGRLRPEVSIARARAELETIASSIAANHPGTKDHHPALVALEDRIVGNVRPALWVLFTAVVLLLLIACANLAGLLLAKSSTRTRELAVRVSLGASRAEIIRLLLTESMLFAILGGATGLLVARLSLMLLTKFSPYDLPPGMSPALDPWVFLFCCASTVAAGLMSGLIPALRSAQLDVTEGLKDGAKSTGGLAGSRARHVLVAGEIALSVALLIGASLLLRSFAKLITTDTGYNPEHVLSARVSLPEAKYTDAVHIAQFWRVFLERAAALPGVRAVGAISDVPMSGSDSGSYVQIEGRPVGADAQGLYTNEFSISPGTFRALGVPLIAGRVLTDRDTAHSPKVVVVNKSFAEKAFPNEDAIGKRFQGGPADGWFTIVGVVGDFRHDGLNEKPAPDMFFNYTQWNRPSMGVEVRTVGNSMAVAPELAHIMRGIDPDLPLTDVKPLGDYIGESLSAREFLLGLIGTFSALAVLLAGIGLYAVLAYSVQQRRREIAIRMALGAYAADVTRIIGLECTRVAAIGLVMGVITSVWASALLKSMLFGIQHTDWKAYVMAIAVLIVAVALAAAIPVARALRTDPVSALRYE
jgi:putative ABC transport system permease protein